MNVEWLSHYLAEGKADNGINSSLEEPMHVCINRSESSDRDGCWVG
jgi:hypothetical protein